MILKIHCWMLSLLFHPHFRNHTWQWAEEHHKDGLSKAYASPSGVYRKDNVLFIAGTRSIGDVIDDLRIPFNDVQHTQRYIDAVPNMHGVSVVVGHSLGGSVALALSQSYPVEVVTYAAPVFDVLPSGSPNHRHRHYLDPIAIFDSGAQSSWPSSLNVHAF